MPCHHGDADSFNYGYNDDYRIWVCQLCGIETMRVDADGWPIWEYGPTMANGHFFNREAL